MFRRISLCLILLACLRPAALIAESEFTVVASYPHDRNAFTQGLLFKEGKLYESTGLFRRSELREVELSTGRVLRKQKLKNTDFGEGLALVGNTLVQLTWTSGHGYLWDSSSFESLGTMPYLFGEGGKRARGWGACSNQTHLVVSDGSQRLYFLDQTDFSVHKTLVVTEAGRPVSNLNELECIGSDIYANVWMTDDIVIIDGSSGKVSRRVSFASLYPKNQRRNNDAVMNGIAWDPTEQRLFVTGKLWPRVYEVVIEGTKD